MPDFFVVKLIYAWIIVVLWRVTGKQLEKNNKIRKEKNPDCKEFKIDYSSNLFKITVMVVLQCIYLRGLVNDFVNNRYTEIAAAVTLIAIVSVIPVSLINALIAGMKKKYIIVATLFGVLMSISWYLAVSMLWL